MGFMFLLFMSIVLADSFFFFEKKKKKERKYYRVVKLIILFGIEMVLRVEFCFFLIKLPHTFCWT